MSDTRFDRLMDEVCPRWGFCGCIKDEQELHVTLLIPPEGPVTADQFVEWLFLADNLNPNCPSPETTAQKAGLREAFVRHMGADVVSASELRWSCDPVDEEAAGAARAKFRGPLQEGST